MFLKVIYNLCLILMALGFIPKVLYDRFYHKKKHPTITERLGLYGDTLRKSKKRLVWIHAVSVGETKAIAPLAKRMHDADPEIEFVVSNGTATGHAEAERSIPFASHYFYLPIDFSWTMSRLLTQLKPDIVLLCESDFWFNFLTLAKKQGAKVYLVNGKISEKSCVNYRRIPTFSKALFSAFDHLFIQNEIYSARFKSLGIPENKMTITGNIKLDNVHPKMTEEEKSQWKKQLGIKNEDKVIVAGSTHGTEEELVIDAALNHRGVKVLLVPRHPERFSEVESLLKDRGVDYGRYSLIGTEALEVGHTVILVDAMGVLKKMYQLADIAIVCGSFVSHVGGHNILEPCEYGIPVIFGPHMHTQPELVALCKYYNAGEQVSKEGLSHLLTTWLDDESLRKMYGKAGKKLIEENQGATERTFTHIPLR